MDVWDGILPHRLLINRSLRKASADLRSRIDAYETNYKIEAERCLAEMEQARADKERAFEKVKRALMDECSKDADLLEKIQENLVKYADQFLQKQCLYKMQEVNKAELQALSAHSGFLTAQMCLIGEEIEILEARKDILTAQAKVDDLKALIRLNGCAIAVEDCDDGVSLLEKVSQMVAASDGTDGLKIQALQKLRAVLQERVALCPVIEYSAWIIRQKKQLSAQMKADRDKVNGKMRGKKVELLEIAQGITRLNASSEEQARAVRAYWAVPITQLNIQISALSKKRNDILAEVRTLGKQIEYMKETGSDDSDTWDELWSQKNGLKELIPAVNSEIGSLETQHQHWRDRQQMLCALCRDNHIYLVLDGKGEASDEYRIITGRLEELSLMEREANQREQERFARDYSQIQQAKKAKTDELSALIAQAEIVQEEKRAVLSGAEKLLAMSKSCDGRFFLAKLFFQTEEVGHAKRALRLSSEQKKAADRVLASAKARLAISTAEFDARIAACYPKPYCLPSAEREEREKLEGRKWELLNPQRQKTTRREERRNDG
ncbi:MAG: hypothetical protein RSB55_01230 [Oscillospiraceae bacterium]